MLFLLSSCTQVFVQTLTHSVGPASSSESSRLLLFGVTAKFTPLSRKVHTTHHFRVEGKSYLVCFTAPRRMTLIMEDNPSRTGWYQFPKTRWIQIGPFIRPRRSSRPDVDFVVFRFCFLLLVAVAFPLLCWIISGCSAAWGPFTFTKPFHRQTNAHTNTIIFLGALSRLSVDYSPCRMSTTTNWHTGTEHAILTRERQILFHRGPNRPLRMIIYSLNTTPARVEYYFRYCLALILFRFLLELWFLLLKQCTRLNTLLVF